MQSIKPSAAPFDRFADNYAGELNAALAITGESIEFYAEERVRLTAGLVAGRLASAPAILDFGCGIGTSVPLLGRYFPGARLTGCDLSAESLRVARERSPQAVFVSPSRLADSSFDLVFTNGVFHHVPPESRSEVLAAIVRVLRPAGILAFWENNGWNPGTRLCMARTPFDADAKVLSPPRARRLVSQNLRIVAARSLFYFPGFMKRLRPLEKILCRLPFGGQCLIIAQKPGDFSPEMREAGHGGKH